MPLAWTGGNPDGGLGTSLRRSSEAIHRAWSEAGVAILVDLGGAETNSEMAIEMLPENMRGRVVICNAPIVEGAVIAATEAARRKPWARCGAPPRSFRRDTDRQTAPGSSRSSDRKC